MRKSTYLTFSPLSDVTSHRASATARTRSQVFSEPSMDNTSSSSYYLNSYCICFKARNNSVSRGA